MTTVTSTVPKSPPNILTTPLCFGAINCNHFWRHRSWRMQFRQWRDFDRWMKYRRQSKWWLKYKEMLLFLERQWFVCWILYIYTFEGSWCSSIVILSQRDDPNEQKQTFKNTNSTSIPPYQNHSKPIGSMYIICSYICHSNQANVAKYTIHGSDPEKKKQEQVERWQTLGTNLACPPIFSSSIPASTDLLTFKFGFFKNNQFLSAWAFVIEPDEPDG